MMQNIPALRVKYDHVDLPVDAWVFLNEFDGNFAIAATADLEIIKIDEKGQHKLSEKDCLFKAKLIADAKEQFFMPEADSVFIIRNGYVAFYKIPQ